MRTKTKPIPTKRQRFNVTLKPDIQFALQERARDLGMTASGLLRLLVAEECGLVGRSERPEKERAAA